MGCFADSVKEILKPYLGPAMADMCVRATALSLGKSFDTLDGTDVPALRSSIQRYLAPVTSEGVLRSVLTEVEAAA